MDKLRPSSEENESAVHMTISGVTTNMLIDSVHDRFEDIARRLIRIIRRTNLLYDMEPVLVADQAYDSILEELPSLIDGFHVHKFVIDNRLLITNISNGNPHSGGVTSILTQTSIWNSGNGNYFLEYTDANAKFGPNKSGAPDFKLNIRPKYRTANQNPSVGWFIVH
jgi:hypothetical protein